MKLRFIGLVSAAFLLSIASVRADDVTLNCGGEGQAPCKVDPCDLNPDKCSNPEPPPKPQPPPKPESEQ